MRVRTGREPAPLRGRGPGIGGVALLHAAGQALPQQRAPLSLEMRQPVEGVPHQPLPQLHPVPRQTEKRLPACCSDPIQPHLVRGEVALGAPRPRRHAGPLGGLHLALSREGTNGSAVHLAVRTACSRGDPFRTVTPHPPRTTSPPPRAPAGPLPAPDSLHPPQASSRTQRHADPARAPPRPGRSPSRRRFPDTIFSARVPSADNSAPRARWAGRRTASGGCGTGCGTAWT